MGRNYRIIILKVFSLLGNFTFLYLAAIVARTYLFKSWGGVWGFILAILFFYGGFTANKGFAFFIPALISVLIYWSHGLWRVMFEVISALILYLVGWRGNFLEFDEILGRKRIYAGAFILIFLFLVTYYVDGLSFLNPWILLSGIVFMLLVLLVQNQGNLDRNIFSKNYINISGGTQKNIRIYNIFTVFILFLLTLLLFNLKNIVLHLIKIAGIVVKTLMLVIIKIISLLISSDGQDKKADIPPQIPWSSEETTRDNSLLDTIIIAVLCLVLVYFVYKVVPVFLRWIKRIIARLASLIAKFLSKTQKSFADVETVDFEDEIEMIKPVKTAPDENRKRRARGGFKGAADNVKKVRNLYRTAIRMLIERNVPVSASDTTGEIYKKSLEIKGIDIYLRKLTDIYERVRYGNNIPVKEEVADAEASCKKALKVLKSGKSHLL